MRKYVAQDENKEPSESEESVLSEDPEALATGLPPTPKRRRPNSRLFREDHDEYVGDPRANPGDSEPDFGTPDVPEPPHALDAVVVHG